MIRTKEHDRNAVLAIPLHVDSTPVIRSIVHHEDGVVPPMSVMEIESLSQLHDIEEVGV